MPVKRVPFSTNRPTVPDLELFLISFSLASRSQLRDAYL